MGLWYQDLFRGIGLAATGAASGVAAGGGPLGGLLGGIYGSVKAGLGGASEGGDAYARNLYQTAIPTAATGLLLYPSTKETASQFDSGFVAPGERGRLGLQVDILKDEIKDLGRSVYGGVTDAADKSLSGGANFFGNLLSGTGKGISDFVSKGGLAGALPLWLASAQRGVSNLPSVSAPALTSILDAGRGLAAPPNSMAVPVPIPANNSADDSGHQAAGFGGLPMLLLVGVALAMLFGKVKLK